MATVSSLASSALQVGGFPALGSKVGPVEMEIDFAAAQTAKGSALAANDIIESLTLYKGAMVVAATLEVVTAFAGVTVLTLDMGVTGAVTDSWVDGFDAQAASVGDFAALDQTAAVPYVFTAEDTIDIKVASLTTALTAGKVRVVALVADLTDLTG